MLFSGLFHIGVLVCDGSSLAGAVSWRKPILFGISTGATVLSIAWVVSKMPGRPGDRWVYSAFALALLVEVVLITVQQWRGVPSHFNRDTPLDRTILLWLELLISVAALVIFETTRRSFGKLSAPRPMQWAIRGGMALLSLSCLYGFAMVAYGNARSANGLSPETFGAAGVMKFPHGMPIHAIQFLPLVAYLLRRAHLSESRQTLSIICAMLSLLGATIFSSLQTFTGRARFDLFPISTLTLAASAACLVPIVLWLLPHRSRQRAQQQS